MKASEIRKEDNKRYYIDILLLIIIIFVAICIRLPSLHPQEGNKIIQAEYLDDEGLPYLSGQDSFYFARQTIRYTDTNDHPKIIEQKSEDPIHTRYRKDYNSSKTVKLFPVFAYLLWKFLQCISRISLNSIIAVFAPVASAIAAIPAYIFVRHRTNRIGGLTAGLSIVLCAAYIPYTQFSSYDTDTVLILLPLLYVCFFLQALESEKTKKQTLYIVLTAISYAVLLMTWTSYGVFFILTTGILVVLAITCLFRKIRTKKSVSEREKNGLIAGLVCTVICIIVSLLVKQELGYELVIEFFQNKLGRRHSEASLYPDPGKFIGEVSKIPLLSGGVKGLFETNRAGVINLLGGAVFCFFSLGALFFILKRNWRFVIGDDSKKQSYPSVRYCEYLTAITILLWTIEGFILIPEGMRFIRITAVPLCLAAGIGMGRLSEWLRQREMFPLAVVICGILISIPALGASSAAKVHCPQVDDCLVDTAIWIKENSLPDSVVFTWWDFGYFYQYKAERRTTGDGGTYNGCYDYWLASALMTDDPKLSCGIARMLAESGIEASEYLDEKLMDPNQASRLLKKVLVTDRDAAKSELAENGLSEEDFEYILSRTHSDSGSDIYLVINKDLLQKMEALAYYSEWDFDKRVSAYDGNIEEMLAKEPVIYQLGCINPNQYEEFEVLAAFKDPEGTFDGAIWKLKDTY